MSRLADQRAAFAEMCLKSYKGEGVRYMFCGECRSIFAEEPTKVDGFNEWAYTRHDFAPPGSPRFSRVQTTGHFYHERALGPLPGTLEQREIHARLPAPSALLLRTVSQESSVFEDIDLDAL